jgi:hypothetical protein
VKSLRPFAQARRIALNDDLKSNMLHISSHEFTLAAASAIGFSLASRR